MQQTRKPGPQRALVLAGGGAKGSYQVGVWQALQELGWTPDIITGASVGALNGCLFTMGKSKEAEDLWRGLEIHDVLEVPDSLKPEELNNFFLDVVRSGGLNVEPLAETIDRLIDEDAVRRSPIRFGLVMTELGTMRRVQCPVEKIPEGQMKDYLLGSSACFPALRPREIDGVKYIDGGWRDNMPLDLAAKMGAAELLGVDVDGIGIVKPNTTGLPTRIIRSHWNLGPTLDFAPERAARNIALGYFDTMRLFDRMGGTAYGIAAVRPVQGKTDAVREALQGYVDRQQSSFEFYLPDQYQVAQGARLEALEDGTVLLVMCQDGDAVFEAIRGELERA